MTSDPIWLDVPFDEKDEAKAAGARWNSSTRRWYAPRAEMDELKRWPAEPDVPDLLPVEDRSYGQCLFVDLVPSSCWFTNVRSCAAPRDWERLRRMVTWRCGQRCEICGVGEDRSAKRWLEVDERWSYDEHAHHQVLKRLICLCTDCHHVTHYGYAAQVLDIEAEVFSHLIEVTKMTPEQADDHVEAAFALWRRRSQSTWGLDLSILTDAGIVVARPLGASERVFVAAETLSLSRPPDLLERGDDVAPPRCSTGKRSAARSFLGRAVRHR
ncbi:MAG: DUF5710 domain-containing protein [Acidimicrobiales bacterium]